jgi:thioredoxin-like negative regulator of GroEL
MKDRFNVRGPVSEDPQVKEVAALHVKELAEGDYDAQVAAAELPVVLDFYATESKACDALSPRYAAVAEKFSGRVRFLKVLRAANAALAARFGVTSTPTLVFLARGKESAERLSGGDIKRTELKARVEAMLGRAPAAGPA